MSRFAAAGVARHKTPEMSRGPESAVTEANAVNRSNRVPALRRIGLAYAASSTQVNSGVRPRELGWKLWTVDPWTEDRGQKTEIWHSS